MTMGSSRDTPAWQRHALRVARWMKPTRDRNLLAEARLALHGARPSSTICSGPIQLELARRSRIEVALRANWLGVRVNGGATPAGDTTVLSMKTGSTLALGGASIGRGTQIRIGKSARLSVGAGTYVNDGCRVFVRRSVSIGARCAIAWNVTILDDDEHGFHPPPFDAPVAIEDDVWIGCNVIVLKGVRIGAGSAVAAGSVVTKSCPPRSFVGGVPAKILRSDIRWSDEQRDVAFRS